MGNSRTLTDSQAAERLNAANRRREELGLWLAQQQAEREQLSRRREELVSQLERRFGTSDLAALRELYQRLRQENSERVVSFERALDEITALQRTIQSRQQSARKGS
jgi:hypothetical protein